MSDTSSTKKEIDSTTPMVELLAQVLSGLQAPLSLGGPTFLGAAYKPYHEILARTGFGWKDVDDFRQFLTEVGIG